MTHSAKAAIVWILVWICWHTSHLHVALRAVHIYARWCSGLLHQQNPAEIAALADKEINYLHYNCM